jgi:hypothetical protein
MTMVICALILPACCQMSSSQYQPGTIVAVALHQSSPGQEGGNIIRYDVSVKVGNTIYMTLYTPPNGYSGVEFSAGIEKLFLVGTSTLTFNSASWGKTEVPIVGQQRIAVQSGLDWAKAPGQYFSMMLRILSESLMLSTDQKTEIKPILEQETSECGQFWANPVVSPDQKLREYGKIVRSSDEKLKVFLTPTQLQKLQEVRAQQSADLKKVLAEQKVSNNN